ncbi:MAG: hypothetical protein MJ143_06495 [Clostridia bacterium]|nr:hypothetical protein [Clostridia bacterium]
MIEMKTNTEEGSCEMFINGELDDAIYDALIFCNAMLKLFEEVDQNFSRKFQR